MVKNGVAEGVCGPELSCVEHTPHHNDSPVIPLMDKRNLEAAGPRSFGLRRD